MAIRKNHQKFIQKSQPVTNSLDEGEKATVEISEANIKSQQALDKLRRQKIGYPDTEILEAGAVEQWLEERKLQLIEDASQTRNHSGFAQSFGVAVVVTGFAMSGGTMAALSPIIIGLGAIGYCTSLVDTKARINKMFPVPFLNLSPSKLVHKLSPDLREMQSDLPEEYDKLDFLPFDKARELLMLTDYQSMIIQLLEQVETGKRFAIYQVLKQAAINYDFGENAKAIAASVNKNIDAIVIDPTLDKEVVENIQLQINPPVDELETEIEQLESVEKINFTLPMDEVRLEELEANNQHKPEDLIPEFAREPRNTMIVGAGGTGKGIVVSNLLRAFKAKHPDYFVIVFDPKGDSKEKGYFEGCVDKLFSYDSLGKTAKDKYLAYEKMWEGFYEILRERGSKILLVIDEATTMGVTYKLVKKSDDLRSKISDLPNLGGSSAVYNMIIAQNTHCEDLGINKGIQNNYARIGLISLKKGEGQTSFETMQRTKFLADCKYSWNDVRVTAEKSPRKRAFYFSKFECWLPIPEMTNYSGYDRDNDTFTTASDNQKTKLQTIHAPRVDHQDTKIQAEQDEIELVFQKLLDAPTTDIKEAIRSTNPDISDSALDKVIFKIRSEAIARNNQALLSKFF